MKQLKYKVDLTDWHLQSVDEYGQIFGKALLAATTEALQLAVESDDTHAYFPAEWSSNEDDIPGCDGLGGPEPEDPLTIYVIFALGGMEGKDPIFSFSLREVLEKRITECAEDGSWGFGLGRISSALRNLADDIDIGRNKFLSKSIEKLDENIPLTGSCSPASNSDRA